MATVDKNFKVKNGLIVGDSTNLVNYISASPSNPFVGQIWIDSSNNLHNVWSGSAWVTILATASGTPLNIPDTLVSRSSSGIFAIGGIDLDLSGTVPLGVGRFQWNSSFGTPEIGLIGGNVTSHIGQHVHAYVTNVEGSPLVKGDVVYLFGASGDRASVKKAINTGDPTSSKTLGVVAEAIETGGQGFITEFGVLDGLNLSAYSPGDALWLSASAGKFTNIKPSAPNHSVFIGVVQRANSGNGLLFVNVQNGYELGELHDVLINSVTNNDIISYNESSSVWFNQNLASAIQEVDGPGSGIDADLLDGQHASYFINTSSETQTKYGDLNIEGTFTTQNLIVSGSTTSIGTISLEVYDPIIYIGLSQYTSDALDLGFIAPYGDIGSSSAVGQHNHTGLVRDHTDKKWKLFATADHPINNFMDFNSPSVTYATLVVGTIETSSSAVVTDFNADMLDGYHASYFLAAGTASSIYLTQANASATYATQQDFDNVLVLQWMGIG